MVERTKDVCLKTLIILLLAIWNIIYEIFYGYDYAHWKTRLSCYYISLALVLDTGHVSRTVIKD